MSYPWTVYKTWVTGEVLTASDLNNSFIAAATGGDPTNINDYSATTTQMRLTTDPYPASVESLATTLDGELQRLRYAILGVTAKTYWYQPPDLTIANIATGTTTFAGAKTFSTALTVNPATNQLVLGGVSAGRTVTITAPQPATSSRTHTIPDITANGTFAFLEGAQTFSGAKTFSATLTMSGATIAMGTQKITGLAAGTTNGDALRYEQLFGGNVTLAGNLVFSPTTKGIAGTTTNDSAEAGDVGEVISSSVTSYANSASSNTYGNITSISLTAGHWFIVGTTQCALNGATMTRSRMAISVNSGNTTSDHVTGVNDIDIAVPTSASNVGGTLGYTLKLSATTTVYLKQAGTFTPGTPQYLGSIYATRVR